MLRDYSLNHHWMPFTANRAFKSTPRMVTSASGVYLYEEHGRKILDGSSGVFCVPAGHCRPEIAEAVSHQLTKLDYTSPFQFSHPGGFRLAEKLSELLPAGMDRVFFANSGSESVDTAMKMALAFHRANGEPGRYRFVSRELAYHGVNFGGLSLGGMVKNREGYGSLLPGVVHMRHTHHTPNTFTRGQAEQGADLADDLERAVAMHGADTIAAVIVEPVVGSVGILVPPAGYLQRLRQIADRHGILLIFDEVITGFGRTGKPFAAETFDVTPDLLTMAKGLTNGSIPMGAIAAQNRIYETITSAAPEETIEFFHGYTYSAHPVSTAAALANLHVFENDGLYERAAELATPFQDLLFSMQDLSIITDIRGHGMLGAMDLAVADKPGKRGFAALKGLFESGLLVRVTNDTIILAPPFVMTHDQLSEMFDHLRFVISRL